MSDTPDGLWWTIVLLDSAIGAGFFIYGIRQKEPLSLVLGIALNVVPMLVTTGLTALLLTALVCVAYMTAKRVL